MKIEKYDLLAKLMIFHMMVTLSSEFIPDSLPLRKILGAVIVLDLLLINASGATKNEVIILMLSVISCIFSTFFAVDYNMHFSDMIYYFSTILFFIKLPDIKFISKLINSLKKNRGFIKVALIYVYAITFLGLFFPQCYEDKWGGNYYYGFSQGSHILCSGICMSVAFIYFLLRTNQSKGVSKVLYFTPALFFILISGARTFLIPMLVVIMMWILVECKNKKYILLALPIILIVIIYAIFMSGFMEKFSYSVNNIYTSSDLLGRLTSGRTVFWLIDLNAFVNSGTINKIFGHGFDFVYLLNEQEYGLSIWAHNDIIDLLLSIGVFGTLLYIILFVRMFRSYFIQKKYIVYIIIYSFGVAIINGFFGYQHYLISFVILYCAINSECKIKNSLDNNLRYMKCTTREFFYMQ